MSPEEDYSSYNKNAPSKQDWLKPAGQLGKLNSAYIGKREGGEEREEGARVYPVAKTRGTTHTFIYCVVGQKCKQEKHVPRAGS